jgi:hypothetical protein
VLELEHGKSPTRTERLESSLGRDSGSQRYFADLESGGSFGWDNGDACLEMDDAVSKGVFGNGISSFFNKAKQRKNMRIIKKVRFFRNKILKHLLGF